MGRQTPCCMPNTTSIISSAYSYHWVTGQWEQHLAQSAAMYPWWGIATDEEKMHPREALSFQLASVDNRTLYFFLPFALAFEGAGLVDTTLVAREVDAEADVPFLTLSSCLF
jgi:hypothetical protein